MSKTFQTEADLQLKTDEHDEEDKAEAEDTYGQADQPSEHTPAPCRIVKLLTSRYGAAALHSLCTESVKQHETGARCSDRH